MTDKYEREGAKAFKYNQTRESCRYKKADCRDAWQRGWDRQAERKAREDAAAKVVRWEDVGGNQWSTPPRQPESYTLRGDAPAIRVHGQSYKPGAWFVSCARLGIDSVRLESLDSLAAKREALVTVTRIVRERLAAMEAIADEDGDLRTSDGAGEVAS